MVRARAMRNLGYLDACIEYFVADAMISNNVLYEDTVLDGLSTPPPQVSFVPTSAGVMHITMVIVRWERHHVFY